MHQPASDPQPSTSKPMGREPSSTAVPETRISWSEPWVRSLAALWIAQVIAELSFSFALPLLPLYVQTLGVPDVAQAALWAGALSAGFSFTMAAFGPIWGVVADRYGRKLMIQRALFGAAVVIGTMGLVTNVDQLLVLRLLQGSVTGVVAASSTLVSVLVPRERLGFSLGLMHSSLFVGMSVGPLIGGIVADTLGFGAAFALTGALFLLSGIIVTLFVSEPHRRQTEDSLGQSTERREPFISSLRETLRSRELVTAIGVLGMLRFSTTSVAPILPLFIATLVEDQSYVATTAGLVLAVSNLAGAVSVIVVGRFVDQLGARSVLIVCTLLAGLLHLPQPFVQTVTQLLVLRVAVGLMLGGLAPSAQALIATHSPSNRRGLAYGTSASFSALGNGAGPLYGSVLAAAFGLPAAFLWATPVFATAALLVALAVPPAGKARNVP